MKYTQAFIYTQKEKGAQVEAISHELSVRAGLIHQVAAGLYDFLPVGTKILKKIENIVREEMNRAGALEIAMPIMQPSSLWHESGRWEIYGEEMFKLKNRSGREFCLGPTHEELIVELAKPRIKSYKDLPVTLYQFGIKFRDEKRPRGGLLRAKEFLMKDAYSFDVTEEGLDNSYNTMRKAYIQSLQRLGVTAVPTSAEAGEMGGSFSEEFIALSEAGEDKFYIDKDGVARKAENLPENPDGIEIMTGIEICHIFKLGTRYSDAMRFYYKDSNGSDKLVLMGSYGIGVSRMIPTIIEQNHDGKGIIWPREVAPFNPVILPIDYDDEKVKGASDLIHDRFEQSGYEVLLDDRNVSAGMKFKDADLLGIPYKVIIGTKAISEGKVEVENRVNGNREMLDFDTIIDQFRVMK